MYQNPALNAPLGPDGLPIPVDARKTQQHFEVSAGKISRLLLCSKRLGSFISVMSEKQKHLLMYGLLWQDFYEDIFEELDKYGEIENLNVCDNLSDHMVGNVYVKFRDENAAALAVQGLQVSFMNLDLTMQRPVTSSSACLGSPRTCNSYAFQFKFPSLSLCVSEATRFDCEQGRFYGGRPIIVEFSPVTDFREATCRQYEENTCSRGGYCNFMHLRPISKYDLCHICAFLCPCDIIYSALRNSLFTFLAGLLLPTNFFQCEGSSTELSAG